MQHFINRQPQDVPVHRCNPVQLPVYARVLDDGIRFIAVFQRARISGSANTRTAASSVVGGGNSLSGPNGPLLFLRNRRALLRIPIGSGPRPDPPRIQIVLKQKLHRAFARLTSLAMPYHAAKNANKKSKSTPHSESEECMMESAD